MKKQGTWRHRLAASAAMMALVILVNSCSSGGGGGAPPPTGITASYVQTDTVAANLVRLIQKTAVGDLLTLQVTIGGTTASSDYYAFAFDILIADPTVAAFVGGTATQGTFLTGSTLTVLASQSGSRVIVGVSKQGAVAGNGTTNAEDVVLELTFRALKVGTTAVTFTGSPSPAVPAPGCVAGAPAAIDSQNPQNCIGSTVFGTGGSITGT